MPTLYYGRLEGDTERRLYDERLTAILSIYQNYRIPDLAPYSLKRRHIANLWWLRTTRLPHTVIAWNGPVDEEAIFLPGELDWRMAITLAREVFGPLVPSAITFRFNNPEEPYEYS